MYKRKGDEDKQIVQQDGSITGQQHLQVKWLYKNFSKCLLKAELEDKLIIDSGSAFYKGIALIKYEEE